MRVVIADDSVLLREGLTLLLTDSGHEVVAAVGDGDAFVAAMREQPDVGIVDVRMPPTHTNEGLVAAVEVLHARPQQPILVLSQFVERSYADELLDLATGGVGYLLKDRISDIDGFFEALRQVVAGQSVLDPQVVRQLMSHSKTALESLTPREYEVLEHIAAGLTNAGIARRMVISEGAVEKHIQRIFGKLSLSNDGDEHRRVAAVLAYLRAD